MDIYKVTYGTNGSLMKYFVTNDPRKIYDKLDEFVVITIEFISSGTVLN